MDWEALFGMSIGFGLLVVVPIVSILTAHQRKMAELMRQQGQAQQTAHQPEILALRQEVAELSSKLNHVILALDDRPVRNVPPPTPEPLRRPEEDHLRLGG